MTISIQTVQFRTVSHTTSILLSRPIWTDQTALQYIHDGWILDRPILVFDSMGLALMAGLQVIKNQIEEEIISINILHSCEMLSGPDVVSFIGAANLPLTNFKFV